MEGRSVVLFLLFLFLLCFTLSSDSQTLNPSTNLYEPEQIHDATIKDINFRAGEGGHGYKGRRGGGGDRHRKASPKRNAAMENQPPLFFSAVSVLFAALLMFSLISFNVSI